MTELAYPHSLRDLRARLSSEEACRDFLFELRWPGGFRCARCGHRKAWLLGNKLYECANCGLQTSVTAGTIFQNTRTPLTVWFRAIWWMMGQKLGATAAGLQRATGLRNYETAWVWLHKLRTLMAPPEWDRLKGVVEVGSGEVRIRPLHAGSGRVFRAIIVVAAQSDDGGIREIRLRRVAELNEEFLTTFIRRTVKRGAVVVTHQAFPVGHLGRIGYIHERVPREKSTGVEDQLTRVQTVLTELERWLNQAHEHEPNSHPLSYIDEFVFRYNSRSKSRGEAFVDLVRRAVATDPQGPEPGARSGDNA
ncbi:MAG TPA: IS1595 family transposase [Bryobacteraceae bacterium]|nr:IS1595 family transposase [Bryobacteraceae bacterium]